MKVGTQNANYPQLASSSQRQAKYVFVQVQLCSGSAFNHEGGGTDERLSGCLNRCLKGQFVR